MIAGMTLVASNAWANLTIMSFSYDNFKSTFDGVKSYTIDYVAASAGHATRLVSPTGDTVTNWSGAFGSANVDVNLDITDIQALTAKGDGKLIWTDVNGDKITATTSGMWVKVGGSAAYSGALSSIVIDTSAGDGVFQGTDGNSFSLNFAAYGYPPATLTGALVQLQASQWFSGSYSGVNTKVSADFNLVPAPAGALLCVMGMGLIGWARRKWIA